MKKVVKQPQNQINKIHKFDKRKQVSGQELGQHNEKNKNKNKNNMRLDVYVVRRNLSGEIRDSAPCLDCYEKMKEYGVRNIIYSCDGGIFRRVRMRDYIPKVVSLGRLFIDTGHKAIVRNECKALLASYITNKDACMRDFEKLVGDGSVNVNVNVDEKESVFGGSEQDTITNTNTITDVSSVSSFSCGSSFSTYSLGSSSTTSSQRTKEEIYAEYYALKTLKK